MIIEYNRLRHIGKAKVSAFFEMPPNRPLAIVPALWYTIEVRVFKNTWFDRFADKEGITDEDLKDAAKQLEKGQFYANLGGGVYKVQVARPGEGKRSGYRVIVFFRSEERTFFEYGFAKSDRDNIGQGELRTFKEKAKDAFSFTDEEIRAQLRKGIYIEIL